MNLKNKTVLVMLVILPTANGWAMDKGMSPGMMPLGPFDLIPLLSIEEKYDNNIFHNNLNPKASLITQIQGGGELALRRKLDRYALRYSFLSSQYHASPDDDFVDHTLGMTTHIEGNIRNRFDLSATVTKGHNMRGTFFSQGDIATQLSEPDQFHQYDADINYRYGRTDARGNLGLHLGWNEITYDNHRERTAQWDRTQLEFTPGFYLRLMPKTYLTTEIQSTFVDYANSGNSQSPLFATDDDLQISSQDYTKRRYLIGATWDQSSKTKGAIRAGYLQQEFSGAAQQSSGGLTWDGQVQWLPLTYSTLSFGLSRDVQPSIGSGSSRQMQVYNASWKHNWPNRIITELSGAYQEALNQGTAQGSVSGMSSKFDVKYQMRSWLDIGVNYSQSDFQATTNNTNSTQNIFMLYVHAMPHAGAN